ncbi:MAG: AAA family ATPase [Candidatus Bathyarchaeota archaeon]|nr:MAG: AAA family ATPase [Candidatus Bathyarchaeota archaeon]
MAKEKTTIEQANNVFFSTGCKQIDEILNTELKRGKLTLIYGKRGTGKTYIAMQCSYQFARREKKVFFIDSNNTFSTNRLITIAGNEINTVSTYIFICKPQTFEEQTQLIANLWNYNLNNIALIILDSATTLYRLDLDETSVFKLNMELNWQLAYLNELAKIYNIPILITSSVNTIIDNTLTKIQPIAQRVVEFWSQNVIYLQETSNILTKKNFCT